MAKLKVPQKLDLNRCCYFELPNTVTEKELTNYAAEYRRQFDRVFYGRIGSCFIFQLPDMMARDKFLLALHAGSIQAGNIVKPTIYCTEPENGKENQSRSSRTAADKVTANIGRDLSYG